MKPTAFVRAASVAAGLALTTVARADPTTVEWSKDWPRVKLWEVAAAAALTIGDTLYEEYVPLPTKASWTKPILFDQWARNTFRADNAGVQTAASTLSDGFFKIGALVPFVVDDYFAALSIHQNVEVAWQLAVIDFESLGVSGIISLAAEHGVGRSRPYTQSCANGEVLDSNGHLLQACGTGNDNRSFFSGQAAATSTVAGLVCIHHQHLPLFGGGFADLAPCLVMIGISAATGVLRLMYDEHWASDVMIGWADGFLTGYVLPAVLHFGFGSGHPPLGQVTSGSLVMAPTVLSRPGGAELGMVGTF
jgi:hypothetical protein